MQALRKITILLIIAVLLTTVLGSAYGFVICDQGCLSDVHHANHHRGEENQENTALPYYPSASDSEDSCTDYAIQLCDGVRLEKLSFPSVDLFLVATPFDLIRSQYHHLPASDSVPAVPKNISQVILAQRTIVLLR